MASQNRRVRIGNGGFRNVSQALQILNQMARMEVAINEVALSGVVSACEKASAWLEAMALLQAARLMSVRSMDRPSVAQVLHGYTYPSYICIRFCPRPRGQ